MSAPTVLVEVCLAGPAAAVSRCVDALLPPGASRDPQYAPVPMDGGRTWLVRCELADATQIASLETHPDVVAVWPDSTVAPM